jgi:hypothetical protein
MTPTSRRRSAATAALVACLLLVAACTQATLTPSPSPSASPVATASASIAPSASPSAAATPTPAPSPTPTASPSPVADCVVKPQEGPLSSDRMTDVVISSTDTADVVTFVFGKMSLPGPGGQPRGDLEVAKAPYTEAGSGQAIDMQGKHVLQLRFTHMSLSSDTGDLTYDGPGEFKPDLTALRHAVLFDMSEGQVGWYIGYDGPGCVTLGRAGNDVTLSFARP